MRPQADLRRTTISTFDSLGLKPELLRAVADQGYTETTPIQAKAIPEVLAGRDLLAAAQTGTGKTAGFTLPMLQRLLATAQPGQRQPRALVLVPTRELAAQVQDSIRTYGKYLRMRSTVIFGGVGMQPQVDTLRRGVDIVVATPGRLLDHAGQRTIDLRQVEILVLDEADRMLDMGFIHDIRKVLALLPAKRQNLLFSATFSEDIRRLASGFLHDPVTVEVAPRNTTAELVSQVVHPVPKDRKRALLAHLVKAGDWHQVLVFTKTKHGANRLAEQLEKDGIEADAIHGNKSQNARTRALSRFKSNELRVLVATDIAARGLDIEELPHVVNYDLPNVPEDYVHRIGRTGRAGASGAALSLVCGEDRPLLAAIEKLTRQRIPQVVVPGFEPGTSAPASERQDEAPRAERQNNGGRNGNGQGREGGQRQRQQQPRGGAGRSPQGRGNERRSDERRGDERRSDEGRGEQRREGQRRNEPRRDPRQADANRGERKPRDNAPRGRRDQPQRGDGQAQAAPRTPAPAAAPAASKPGTETRNDSRPRGLGALISRLTGRSA